MDRRGFHWGLRQLAHSSLCTAIAFVSQARGDDLSQSAPYQRVVAWAASRASGAESLSVMLRVRAMPAEGHYFPAAVQEGLLTLLLGHMAPPRWKGISTRFVSLGTPSAAGPSYAHRRACATRHACSFDAQWWHPATAGCIDRRARAQAADDFIEAAPLPTDDNALSGASQGGAGHSALVGITALAWSSLDTVDLAADFGRPMHTMQSVPVFLRAGVRQAFVFALRAVREAYTRGAAPQQTRAGILFLLSPR
ncbi:unnamed protein product [Symbiodinium sp. CCMP2592]|nr:unnamed protein product [Symbiodinium sp. CCMP2592]